MSVVPCSMLCGRVSVRSMLRMMAEARRSVLLMLMLMAVALCGAHTVAWVISHRLDCWEKLSKETGDNITHRCRRCQEGDRGGRVRTLSHRAWYCIWVYYLVDMWKCIHTNTNIQQHMNSCSISEFTFGNIRGYVLRDA